MKACWGPVFILAAIAAPPAATAAPAPLPRLVHVSEASLAEPLPVGSPTDTLYLLGGPGQLSGKFEDGAGQPDRQGWTGVDLTALDQVWWSVSTFNAAALDPATPGNHAWWCGRLFEPCTPEDPPEGTGDNWQEQLVWTGTVPNPARPVTVRVRARISYGTDPANDYLYLQAWGEPYWPTLGTWTAYGTAVAVDRTVELTPDNYTGPGGDEVRLRWLFLSDGAFSDEDCLWPGTGAQVDSIVVTFDQGGGEVQQGGVETCEPGDPLQWVPTPLAGVGDFSAVRAGLGDIDPDHENASPQFTFIDDGLVVPGTGGTPCITWCYGPDGWIVNQDGGLADYYAFLDNEVRSPPLAVPAGDRPGALLAFDVYLHAVLDGSMRLVVPVWHVRSTADPAGVESWSAWRDRGTVVWGGPGYVRVHQEVGDLLEPDAAWIQIALGARDLRYTSGHDGTPAPYFDNVAFKVFARSAPAVLTVHPDGTGDYPTIQTALEAAAVGDTVQLADGVYTGFGNRDLDWLGKDVVVRSQGGNPAACIIDCEGSPEDTHRAARFDSGEGPGAALMGITLRNAVQVVEGGAVLVHDASPTFFDCVFTGNRTATYPRNGGAVAVWGGAPAFVRCDFTENRATRGGAVTVRDGAQPLFEDCLFAANIADQGGAAVHAVGVGTAPVISGGTLVGSQSWVYPGAIALFDGAAAQISNTIVAFGVNGAAIHLDSDGTATAALACCDLYGNPAGDWTGPLAAQFGQDGNISADPRFCGTWGGADPWGLMATSPCAPEASAGCGLVGARPVLCSDPSPVPEDLPAAPRLALRGHPNPFNPATTLAYTLTRGGRVDLRIHDLRHRLVRTLVAGSEEAGPHSVVWRGDDDAGRTVASGVYLAVLTTADGRATVKLALVR